jgi:hypothetical protein
VVDARGMPPLHTQALPALAPQHALPRRRPRCARAAAVHARAQSQPQEPPPTAWAVPRRGVLSLPLALLLRAAPAAAATAPLWERLERRELDKPIFNAPPAQQVFPDWLEGTWEAKTAFAGYAFPSKRIDKACVCGVA